MHDLIQQISDKFRARFGVEPLLVMSPGRVNLIGEHTDYNEGFVLPAAIDKAVVFAVAPRQDTVCHFVSQDYGQEFRCDLHELGRSPLRWPDYLEGVIDQFVRNGYAVRGFQCVFGGNIPIGAGMSSSAALEGGLAFAVNEMFRLKIDSLTLVKLAQKAENKFVGVHCGIMDQFINIHGLEKKVLKLDCRSLEFEYFPFERPDLRIVVCDSLVRRELASSEYNVRRRQCEEGVEVLKKYAPGIRSLRDVGFCLLEEHRADLDPVVYRRCDYVIRENIRVEEACRDLLTGDFKSFGERMGASHAGLRDGYEVSSPELDALVEAAAKVEGVLGARMMGAGFGGCVISLVEEGAVPELRERVSRDYQASFGRTPNIHVIRIEAGTHVI
ncbi:MAG: galactokinase [Candidatus Aminicenantes bacterium]|nr:galactokinase [Candidatus Aminicenantes bacterium]